jgi:hypothetical protein
MEIKTVSYKFCWTGKQTLILQTHRQKDKYTKRQTDRETQTYGKRETDSTNGLGVYGLDVKKEVDSAKEMSDVFFSSREMGEFL